MSIFIVSVYDKAWFTAAIPAAAPRNDLEFLKQFVAYTRERILIKEVVFDKFMKHL